MTHHEGPKDAKFLAFVFLAGLAVLGFNVHAQDAVGVAARAVVLAPRLSATVHPPLPDRPADYWFVPDNLPRATSSTSTSTARAESPAQKFARGAALIDGGELSAGLPLVSTPELAGTALASYAQYYRAVALIGLNRLQEAEDVLTALAKAKPDGYLEEAVPLRLADVKMSRQDARDAVSILNDLSKQKALASPEDVLIRLGRANEAAGNRDKAIDAYRKVYYESPMSQQANDAQDLLNHLDTASLNDKLNLELARAERLFAGHRYAQARAGFEPLGRIASGEDKDLVALRLAECDYYLDRFRAARTALEPFLEKGSRRVEARFFYLTATRSLGEMDTYVRLSRDLINDSPDSTWTIETLNNLAQHYVVTDDDESADGVFRELFERFPDSRYAERAAWKIGWWAYRNGRFADAALAFERGAAAFPRGDTRPAWLYWSGRAHDQVGETAIANDRYRLELADYQNTYYGRLAETILEDRGLGSVDKNVTIAATSGASQMPTEPLIRQLVGLEMYDAALKELQHAQLEWGDSPPVAATVAWIHRQQSRNETAQERFNDLRGAMTMMKRAYPQYLAAGGEDLPPPVLEVIFPLDYWPLIKKYSDANDLDPYLMAALVAQESTFTADIRSGANAYGLMQLLPSAGRMYAAKVGLGRFTMGMLTQPDANIRMGMRYFKDISDRLGGAHYALASYNAGPSKVARWISERPGLSQDEFIDDIPYPETQNYVKRILGTAADYRRLYGGGLLTPGGLTEPPIGKVSPASPKAKPKAPATRKAPARKKAPAKTQTR